MRILDQYIAKAISWNILMALLVLGFMDTLFAFVAELEDISETYRALDAGIFALATFPRRCYEFIPVSSLMGTLLALGNMASTSELTVMRSAGISVGRIIGASLVPVMLFAGLALFLGQYVIPPFEQYGRAHRAVQQGGGTMLKVKQGNWHREGNDLIHISAVERDGTLHGVTRFSFDGRWRLTQMSLSQLAEYSEDHWQLDGESQTLILPNEVRLDNQASKRWLSSLTPDMVELVISRAEYLSITRLFSYTQYLAKQELDNRSYLLAFWKKILQPVATAIMVLLACAFIFGPLRSVTVGLRIIVGLVIGMLFHYLQDFMVHASTVFSVPAVVATLLPIIVFLGIGLIMIRRVR